MTHTITVAASAAGFPPTVIVDGHDIGRSVRGANIRVTAGELPEVELELLVLSVDGIELEDARVVVPDATRDALIALGWTPPKEDTGA